MLEKLWLKEELENKLIHSFIFSIVFSFLSIFVTRYILHFKIGGYSYSGIVSVLLISLASSYPLISYIERKEEEEERLKSEFKILKQHEEELTLYLVFFLGVTFTFVFSYFLLPESFFSLQIGTINSLTQPEVSSGFFSTSFLNLILKNNLFVFSTTFIVSFLFSAGMIFILVWNASVLGVFLSKASNSLTHLPIFSLGYLPHGLIEISSYILAGLSGFLLSRQIENLSIRDESHETSIYLFEDSLVLVGIGLVMLFVAGILEVL